ncbi:MAG: N-acetylmuramoyl-L-alanine amidase, partial [Oscillospiraceae bacterium]
SFYKSIKLNRALLAIFLIICILFITLVGINVSAQKSTQSVSAFCAYNKTIIIDAGHGGFDSGAIACDGSQEQIYNLKISQKVRELFLSFGYNVIMTREDENAINNADASTIREKKKTDMYKRMDIMTKAQNPIFISIHQNTSPSKSAKGSVVYFTKNLPDAEKIAQSIQSNITDNLQPENKRTIVEAKSNLFLLHKATCPAVLVECGFISNKADLDKIKKDEYQNKISFLIFKGVNDFIQSEYSA